MNEEDLDTDYIIQRYSGVIIPLRCATTQELVDELSKRVGVTKHYVQKMNCFKIYIGGNSTPFFEFRQGDSGEATILVVKNG
jgi:hypothetical protein